MDRECLNWNVQVAVFAISGFLGAFILVIFQLSRRERFVTVRALLLLVELFVVLLLKVDVIHIVTDGAFFYVAAAVAKVSGHFALRVLFQAVIAALHRFVLHLFGIYVQK